MDIGFGFRSGWNQVSKGRILSWLHCDNISWKAFLWYISEYIEIVRITDNEMTVNLISSKQREYFYKKVREYNSEIAENNYKIDRANNLWRDHHRNSKTSEDILVSILL